jgi:hypothetical protein
MTDGELAVIGLGSARSMVLDPRAGFSGTGFNIASGVGSLIARQASTMVR